MVRSPVDFEPKITEPGNAVLLPFRPQRRRRRQTLGPVFAGDLDRTGQQFDQRGRQLFFQRWEYW